MKKNRIKTFFLIVVFTMTLSGIYALADPDLCLNIRDYGRHIYNHRVYSVEESAEVVGTTPDGYIHSIITTITRGECVCGKPGEDIKRRDVYKPIP